MSKPKYLIDIGENGDDNHHAWLKHNKEIQRIYSILSGGGYGGGDGGSSGGTGGTSTISKDMQTLRDELDRLDSQLEGVLSRIAQIMADDQKAREELDKLAEETADKVKELEDDTDRLSKRSSDMENSVNKSLQDMGDTITQMDQKREELSTDAKDLQSKVDALTETATGLQKSQDELTVTVNGNKENISQISQKADEINSTVVKNKTDQDSINDGLKAQISGISQTSDGITTIVADLNKEPVDSPYSSIAKLNQRADSIESTVSSNKAAQDTENASLSKQISDVKQTAEGITAVVENLNKDPGDSPYSSISKLNQTASEIYSTVESNKAAQDSTNSDVQTQISKVSQKANEVDTVVAELNKSADEVTYKSISDVNQKADSIESTVKANKTAQDTENAELVKQISDVKQTADGITAVVEELNNTETANKYGAISKLQQRADTVESTVSTNKTTQDDKNSELETAISDVKQTASGITAVVENLNNEDPSKSPYKSITALDQNANRIRSQASAWKNDSNTLIRNVNSTLAQTANSLSAEINEITDNLNNEDTSKSAYKAIVKLQANIDGVSSTVAADKTALETADNEIKANVSSIDQKADSISTMVSGITTGLNDTDLANSPYKVITTINQTLDSIQATVTNNRNDELSQISTISQKANEVDTIVAELNKTPDACTYTAISSMNQTVGEISSTVAANKQDVDGKFTAMQSNIDQLNDKIALSIKKGDDIVSAINLSPDGVHIEGKFVKIDGTTIINNKVISGDNLKDQTITVDKLNVNELSAITAKIGHFKSSDTGARVDIQDSLIQVFDENDTLRVRLGMW